MSKKFIRFLCLTFVTCLLFSVAAGCGSQQKNTADSSGSSVTAASSDSGSTSAEKVKIRIMTRFSGSDASTPALKKIEQNFMEKNPNVEIVDESINDEASFTNKFKAAAATGNLPDLFHIYNASDYAKNGLLMDLKPIFDEDKSFSGGFVPGLVDTVGKFPDLNGLYVLPADSNYEVFYYNTEVFDKAGIKQTPATYEELIQDIQKLKTAGYTPIGAGAKDAWRLTHIFNGLWEKSIGAQRGFELGTGKTKFSDPDAVEVLKRLKNLADSGAFDKNLAGIDYASEKANFFAGKTGMMYNGTWFIGEIESSPIRDKVKAFLMPDIKNSKFNDNDVLYANGYGISNLIKDEAEKKATIEFAKYLTGKEGTELMFTMAKKPSIRTDISVDLSTVSPLLASITDLEKSKVKVGGTDIFAYTLKAKMESIINNNIVAVVLGGKTPEDAAKILADEMTKD